MSPPIVRGPVSLFYYYYNYFGMYFMELLKLRCVEDRIMYLSRQQWSMFFFFFNVWVTFVYLQNDDENF